jgi:SET domain-containing protein
MDEGQHVEGCHLRWGQSAPDSGRGVFATRPIKAGEVIERSPVIVIPHRHKPLLDRTVMTGYYFAWGDGLGAVGLGMLSLYNHSFNPNCDMVKDLEAETISAVALRDIEPGEELAWNYNGKPDAYYPVFFPEPLESDTH